MNGQADGSMILKNSMRFVWQIYLTLPSKINVTLVLYFPEKFLEDFGKYKQFISYQAGTLLSIISN